MGCDIHFCTERLYKGRWVNTDYWQINPWKTEKEYEHIEVYGDRNYELFSILADVRSKETSKPMSQPKGLPEDITEETRYILIEDLAGDGHSLSHHYLDELYNYWINMPEETERCGVLVGETLEKFDKEGIEPECWCSWYGGPQPQGFRTWKTKHNPMDNMMKTLLCHWHCRCWDWMKLDYIKSSEEIKEFVQEYGKQYRILFGFDN